MFLVIADTKHTLVLELGLVVQGSLSTGVFMTGRPHMRSEMERWLGGGATFTFMRATEDEILRFLREKLRKEMIPDMMSSTLEGDIVKSIPATSSGTYA